RRDPRARGARARRRARGGRRDRRRDARVLRAPPRRRAARLPPPRRPGLEGRVKLGIDVLLARPSLERKLAGRRLGLLAHPASMTGDFRHAVDALMARPATRLVSAFGPK